MVSFRSHLAAEVSRAAPGVATLLVAAITGLLPAATRGAASDAPPMLQNWLNAQTNIQTWRAEVRQIRTFKTLAQPLTNSGRVLFAAPNWFRWEIGDPPQTIALRQPKQMLVIYPRLKRAERYPLAGEQTGPWKETLALLEAGFPRSQAELEARFRITSHYPSNDVYQVFLQPKSTAARRMMPEIRIGFGTNDFTLRITELHFADSSIIRSEFSRAELNVKVDGEIFTPKLDSEYKIVEPLAK